MCYGVAIIFTCCRRPRAGFRREGWVRPVTYNFAWYFGWYFLLVYSSYICRISEFLLSFFARIVSADYRFSAGILILGFGPIQRSSPWCTSPPTCRHHNTTPTHKFRLPHCSYSLYNSLHVKWFPQFFFGRHHRYILLHQSRGVGRWNNSDALPLWSSDE